MKDFIVLLATIVLGIAIVGVIIGFESNVSTLSTKAGEALTGVSTTIFGT